VRWHTWLGALKKRTKKSANTFITYLFCRIFLTRTGIHFAQKFSILRKFIMTPLPHSGARNALALREVKLLSEPILNVVQDGIFEGYASLFGVPDLSKDIVIAGAFRDTIALRGAGGIKLLWQHNPSEPLGRWLSVIEDGRGLRVRGQLNLAVSKARDIYALIKDGAIDGLSIGFRAQKTRPDARHGFRRLERIDLWEISIVTFPMLPQARVLHVKHDPPATRLNILLRSLTALLNPSTKGL
jgi:HK97 family phage prohead protease